ncbi:MAG: hypothetical protein AB8B47_06555 [Roseobacter sp.]
MEKLLHLKFQRKQGLVAKLVEQEQDLRSQLRQVSEQDARADLQSSDTLRALGADVIWKSWVGRTKNALNIELAQVLAQKEILLADVRRDYGKLTVSREVLAADAQMRMRLKSKKMLEKASEGHFLRKK